MKRIALWCLVFVAVLVVASTEAYQVHEEQKEDDETICEKCQQNSATVIGGIFNTTTQIPIAEINQTTIVVELTPKKSGKIDNTLKNKKRQQQQQDSAKRNKPQQRRYDLEQIRKRVESQREQQRAYQQQLQRRQHELIQQYSKRLQQEIASRDERADNRFYRDPYGFNSLTQLVVGPRGIVVNRHNGHGDGHVYQYYTERKPLHFGRGGGGEQEKKTTRGGQDSRAAASSLTQPSSPTTSATSKTTVSVASANGGKIIAPIHVYAVHEVVDEGANPFTWPNWFGILNALSARASSYPSFTNNDDNNGNKLKVKWVKQPQNNNNPLVAPKARDYYRTDNGGYYAKGTKNYDAREEEITDNEIDADVTGRVGSARILFVPAN